MSTIREIAQNQMIKEARADVHEMEQAIIAAGISRSQFKIEIQDEDDLIGLKHVHPFKDCSVNLLIIWRI